MKEVEMNRVAAELNAWRDREERFEKLFPGTLRNNRPFLKEKLNTLDTLNAKYRGTQDRDEQLTLRILKNEREQLAQTLYPGLIARLIYYIISSFQQRQIQKEVVKVSTDGIQSLKERLAKTGFTNIEHQLEYHIKQGQNSFSIPLSYYVNEKDRMDHSLSFIKDERGLYQLEGYQAALNREQAPDGNRKQNFYLSKGEMPTAEQAYNLLNGRAVYFGSPGKEGRWTQLDLNDKDASGDHRWKEFPANYGFDVEKVIRDMSLDGSLYPVTPEQLVQALKNGNRPELTVDKEGSQQKIFIEANPQFKSLNIYNEQGKKISLSSLKGKQIKENNQQAPKIIELRHVHRKAKKKGLSA